MRLGGPVGFATVSADGWRKKVSKILATLTGSALHREGYFELPIVVFIVCACFWRTVRMKSLTMFSGDLHFLHYYKSNLAHLL